MANELTANIQFMLWWKCREIVNTAAKLQSKTNERATDGGGGDGDGEDSISV